jgi:hypothetical protein
VTRQKIMYNKNKLPEEKITKLNSVGIRWDQKNDWWEQSFSDYKKFRTEWNREPLHTAKDKFEKDIALWITRQRKAYKKNKLSQERTDKLNLINFVWDIKEVGWNQAFNDYQTFKKNHGREPSNSSKDEFEIFLAHWVQTQRGGYGRDKRPTPQDRIDKLNSINFVWDLKEEQWEKSLNDYKEFKSQNKREPSNRSKNKLETSVGSWANRQRVEYNKKRLSPERIEILNSSGFEFDRIGDPWAKAFNEYVSFKTKFGREPRQTSNLQSERFIGIWASRQRISFKKNKLSKDRIEKLNSIGFKWSIGLKRVQGRFMSN